MQWGFHHGLPGEGWVEEQRGWDDREHANTDYRLQIARPGVVAEAAPQVQHLVEVGARQRLHRWKPCRKPFEVGRDRTHLRLLEHDFRQPHAVRRVLALPREVLPAVGVPPDEQTVGERADHLRGHGTGRGATRGFAADFHRGRARHATAGRGLSCYGAIPGPAVAPHRLPRVSSERQRGRGFPGPFRDSSLSNRKRQG